MGLFDGAGGKSLDSMIGDNSQKGGNVNTLMGGSASERQSAIKPQNYSGMNFMNPMMNMGFEASP